VLDDDPLKGRSLLAGFLLRLALRGVYSAMCGIVQLCSTLVPGLDAAAPAPTHPDKVIVVQLLAYASGSRVEAYGLRKNCTR
jgi:hypothetical protein